MCSKRKRWFVFGTTKWVWLIESFVLLIATANLVFLIETFYFFQTEIKLSRDATENSFLHRIYHKKNFLTIDMRKEQSLLKGRRCILERDLSLLNLISSPFLSVMATETSGKTLWNSSFRCMLFLNAQAEIFLLVFFEANFLYFLIASSKLHLDIWILDHDTVEFNTVLYYR